MKKEYTLFIGLSLSFLFLDQASKLLVINSFEEFQAVSVIPGFFSLVFVKNTGIVFGFFSGTESNFLHQCLIAVTIAAIIAIFVFFILTERKSAWLTLGASFLFGGAIGNLVDRVRLGYVVDFLDFHIGSYHWPAFNVADSSITLGTFCLLLAVIKKESF